MGSADGHRAGSELFVCFPSRTNMSLMPKQILSPGRSGDATRRIRNGTIRGQSSPSPMFSMHGGGRGRSKNNSDEIEEPTSPKVTCAGQVRVKPTKQCKNWQSVMAEIEKLHENKQRKRGTGSMASPGRAHPHPKWGQVMGLKKEVVQFVTALRNLRVDFGCFGPPAAVTSDDEEEEEEEDEEEEDRREPASSGTVFAKWFMILQDNDEKREKVESSYNNNSYCAFSTSSGKQQSGYEEEGVGDENSALPPPPPNALLLMRCRSAPSSRSCFTRVEDSEREKKGKDKADLVKKSATKTKSAVVVRRCEPDISGLVSKETWISQRDFIHQSFMRSVSLKG